MKRFILTISVVLLSLFVLASCESEKENNEGNTTDGAIMLKTITDVSEYKIVREDKSSDDAKKPAISLKKGISSALGIDLSIVTDDAGESEKEILVGKTNRKQSTEKSEGLLYGDWFIGLVDEKIVITADSYETLDSAVSYFIKKFVSAENKTLKVPALDGYFKHGKYAFDKLTVDGVDISEFKLYTAATEKFDIDAFNNKLKTECIGEELECFPAGNPLEEGTHYLIIDNTGLLYDEFSYTFENGNIYIKSSYSSVQTAADYFVEAFLSGKNTREYNLTAADNYSGSLGKKKIYTKEQLEAVLTKVYNDDNACIIGEEAIPLVENALNRFKKATGENPGMVGMDLTPYGTDLSAMTDEEWSKAVCQIVEYCSDKGIVNISTHFTNPSGNFPEGEWQHCRGTLGVYKTVAEYEDSFKQVITEGTDYNKAFKTELERIGKFLCAIKDNGVPILYRPLHEMNGYWFWWCVGQGTNYVSAESYTNLWKYVYNYFTKDLGLDNMLWVYAPDYSDNTNDVVAEKVNMSVMYCYPGDEYVDIVGVDWYTVGGLEITSEDCYLTLAEKTGKNAAITEFGPRGQKNRANVKQDTGEDVNQVDLYNSLDLYNDLMQLKGKGYKFTYLLTWINQWSIPNLGLGDQFMAKPYTYGQNDVAKVFESIK